MQYANLAAVLQAWESGELDALEAHIELKKLEDQLKAATETVRPFVRAAAELVLAGPKDRRVIGGFEVSLAETGTKWDYSGCNSTTLAFLEKQAEKAKEELAAYQKFLQTLPGPTRDIDPETGEPVEDEHGMPVFMTKAVKTSTSFVKLTTPKK